MDTYLFADIVLPIIIILVLSILLSVIIGKNLGVLLSCMGLIIALLCWLEFLDIALITIAIIFIVMSLYIGINNRWGDGYQ